MNAEHQCCAAAVAEACALDVPAAEGRSRAGHRNAVALPQEQETRLRRDRENNCGLPGGAARILDLRDPRAGADRLLLGADRGQRRVSRVEADQRRGGERLGDHLEIVRMQSTLPVRT
jgi:hypothetical protein